MFTRSLTNCSENLNKFREAQVKEASSNTLRRIAGLAIDSLENAGAKLKLVQQIGEELIEAINTCTTIKNGDEAAKKFCDENDKHIQAAE